MESWQGRNIVFEGRIFSVTSGLVRLENGEQAQRDVVAHPGGVAIVAEEGGDLLFVRQFRFSSCRDVSTRHLPDRRATEDPE